MNTFYTFIKDGQRYTMKANNRTEAQKHLEFLYRIDLAGADWEESFKNRLVAKGTIK